MIRIDPALSNKLKNLSFVCSVFVVLVHSGTVAPVGSFTWGVRHFLYDIFGRLAVPFFFLASGFLLAGHMGEEGWYATALKKRFWTLVVPYVFNASLYAVYLLPLTVLANVRAGRGLWEHLAIPPIAKIYGLVLTENPALYPLWYLRWLIILVLFSPLIYLLLKKWMKTTLAVVFLYAMSQNEGGALLPEKLQMLSVHWLPFLLHPIGTFFYLLGIAWRMGCIERIAPGCKRVILAFGVGFIALKFALILLYSHHPDGTLQWVYSAEGNYQVPDFAIYPAVLYVLWKVIPSRTWPVFLTQNSFALYVWHAFAGRFVNGVQWFAAAGMSLNELYWTRFWLAVVGVFCVSWCMRRYWPMGVRLFLGGR